MPASGVALQRLVFGGPAAALAPRLGADAGSTDAPALVATLAGPAGGVTLRSI